MASRIGIVGCGTVGRGLVSLLGEKRDFLEERHGFSFKLTFVSSLTKGTVASLEGLDPSLVLKSLEKGDLASLPGCVMEMPKLGDLLSRFPVDFVCDATPTNYETGEPSMGVLRSALESGANAVTSSKGGVGLDLAGLKKLASESGVQIRCESSVLSGTPLISLVRGPLAGCEVIRVEGIVNGTTNYILTMMEGGAEYGDALNEAQRLGYAETDPTGDVEGFDAAVKVCIMAQEFFGYHLRVSDVDRTGITGVTAGDIRSARESGKRVKLIAGVGRSGGAVRGFVKPSAVDLAHPLASVMGAANAVCISTDNLGDVTIVGPGAGARETAQGMLSDMLEIAGRR
jgi:homoserine dehydrogenase